MSVTTGIEWTDAIWSPLRVRVREDAAQIAEAKGYASLVEIAKKMAGHVGPHCEHVSDGCKHCYSGTNNHRCLPSNRTGLPFDRRSRDLVDSIIDERILAQPLKWRAPKRIFVENQADLFGEWVTDEQIDRVFAVMALCPWHTFQVLTKRERMLAYITTKFGAGHRGDRINSLMADGFFFKAFPAGRSFPRYQRWPLPNVWLGVSVEDQKTADERIPWLLQTPAAVRFVSYEPALGPVNFMQFLPRIVGTGFHWIIVGGESGAGARPFDITWARNAIALCKAAGVACFVKQLGAASIDSETDLSDLSKIYDRKGGNWDEWPADLRVREFPEVRQR